MRIEAEMNAFLRKFLEKVESIMTGGAELLENILLGEVC